MGLLKTALIGAAIYGAIKYLTEKDALGRTRFDDIKEQAPEWLEKAKTAVNDLREEPFPQEYGR